MKEIGATLNLSESRVSQMHSSIVQRLQADRRVGLPRRRREQPPDAVAADIREPQAGVQPARHRVVGPHLQQRPVAPALGNVAQAGLHERAGDALAAVFGRDGDVADAPARARRVQALQRDVAHDPALLDPHIAGQRLVEERQAEHAAQERSEDAGEVHVAQRAAPTRIELVGEYLRHQVRHLAHMPARVERGQSVARLGPQHHQRCHLSRPATIRSVSGDPLLVARVASAGHSVVPGCGQVKHMQGVRMQRVGASFDWLCAHICL
ncbi:MAG: flagellar biosynthesis sigma factor [Chloroflexi bacterium ADurb.Bin325]|nr:MAG: flagellar biosynthesis sigma factor [Chloroflexi bacterium ADurb.Bin325]